MTYQGFGRVTKGVGGLFWVRVFDTTSKRLPADYTPQPLDGCTVSARGRGNLHRKGALLVGDLVQISYDDGSFTHSDGVAVPAPDGAGIAIEKACQPGGQQIRDLG